MNRPEEGRTRRMSGPDEGVVDLSGVSVRWPRMTDDALIDATLSIRPGEFLGILGPNGSGKSTLLRAIAGSVEPRAGTVSILGRAPTSWDPRTLAQRLAVVPQGEVHSFPITVRELIEMGRYPHLGPWEPLGTTDRDAVERAMAECGVDRFGDREITTLSGGERQRARIARALAQEPSILLLDEPTAALDLRYEMEIFELASEISSRQEVTVILVTHEMNLAARHADRLALLDQGRILCIGTPDEVIRKELLEPTLRWPLSIRRLPVGREGGEVPQLVPLPRLAGENPPRRS